MSLLEQLQSITEKDIKRVTKQHLKWSKKFAKFLMKKFGIKVTYNLRK